MLFEERISHLSENEAKDLLSEAIAWIAVIADCQYCPMFDTCNAQEGYGCHNMLLDGLISGEYQK